jgi:hypothetical protein
MRVRKSILAALSAGSLSLISIPAASAAPATPLMAAGDYAGADYGAYAYSLSADQVAVTSSETDLNKAEGDAIDGCRALAAVVPSYTNDCRGTIWVYHGWAAFAVHHDNAGIATAWGAAWDNSSSGATRNAIHWCEATNRGPCHIGIGYGPDSFKPDPKTMNGGTWSG